jgi:hypothetical protein
VREISRGGVGATVTDDFRCTRVNVDLRPDGVIFGVDGLY